MCIKGIDGEQSRPTDSKRDAPPAVSALFGPGGDRSRAACETSRAVSRDKGKELKIKVEPCTAPLDNRGCFYIFPFDLQIEIR